MSQEILSESEEKAKRIHKILVSRSNYSKIQHYAGRNLSVDDYVDELFKRLPEIDTFLNHKPEPQVAITNNDTEIQEMQDDIDELMNENGVLKSTIEHLCNFSAKIVAEYRTLPKVPTVTGFKAQAMQIYKSIKNGN